MTNTKAYNAQGQPISTKPLATLANAQTLMAAGAAQNVDPRVLVAISFVEGKWGGDAPAARTDNSFGLMSGGGLGSFTNIGQAIYPAAQTVARHINADQDTVEELYSGHDSKTNGGLAAYCVGANCSNKVPILNSKLKDLKDNTGTLENECYKQDGSYYEKNLQ